MRLLLWKVLRWILFRLDAELAHTLTVRALRATYVIGGGIPLRLLSKTSEGRKNPSDPPAQALGMTFQSRVGLAAGFDKNAELVSALPHLGFGFAEIGTVTPRPQPGNPRPRLFRDPVQGIVFNRMGFNGLGAALVSRSLQESRTKLPENFRVGVNIGKNKDTPLEDAARDYALAAAAFEGLADYLVINVSSPNTPGLRSLQTIEALRPIVEQTAEVTRRWRRKTPLLLKLAPEVRGDELAELIHSLEQWGIDGWVLTNTLGGTWPIPSSASGADSSSASPLQGGLSGSPLTVLSRESLVEARKHTTLPIVSVGGILTADEAAQRLRLGADLVQIYSGWILNGPSFPVEVSRRLAVTF